MQNNSIAIDFENNNSIFNKTCNDVSNRLINTIPTQELRIIENLPQTAGEVKLLSEIKFENTGELKNSYYNICGTEVSLWVLLLSLIVIITIIYFLYKWFFSSGEQIVNVKKSKNTPKLNEKLNDETETNTETETKTEQILKSTISN